MSNDVNLYCTAGSVVIDESNAGTAGVTCGNLGPDAATGPVSLKIVTPFYLNVPTLPSVPGATVAWVYENTDVDVPSIFQVTFADGIANGATVTVSFDVVLDPSCPDVPPLGRAIFTTNPGNTVDVDSDLSRNLDGILPVRAPLVPFTAGTANLYFTHDFTIAVPGGGAVSLPVEFYNGAGSPGTADVAHFTFFTPIYTEVPATGRPSGFTVLYENTVDPAMPSIYRLVVPAGLGSSGPDTPTTISIPYQVRADSPMGSLRSVGIIVPTGRDTQGNRSASHHMFGLMTAKTGAV
jgi:hypothetical protein